MSNCFNLTTKLIICFFIIIGTMKVSLCKYIIINLMYFLSLGLCTNTTTTTIIWPPNTAAYYLHRRLRDWHRHHHHHLHHLVIRTHTSIMVKLAWSRGLIMLITQPWIQARLTHHTPLFQVMENTK